MRDKGDTLRSSTKAMPTFEQQGHRREPTILSFFLDRSLIAFYGSVRFNFGNACLLRSCVRRAAQDSCVMKMMTCIFDATRHQQHEGLEEGIRIILLQSLHCCSSNITSQNANHTITLCRVTTMITNHKNNTHHAPVMLLMSSFSIIFSSLRFAIAMFSTAQVCLFHPIHITQTMNSSPHHI